ncbi:zinc finger protein CCHC domain-containing protein 8 isoform X1, partial [Sigmodon hispidus]
MELNSDVELNSDLVLRAAKLFSSNHHCLLAHILHCPRRKDLGKASSALAEPQGTTTSTETAGPEPPSSPAAGPTVLCQKEEEDAAEEGPEDGLLDNGSVLNCDMRNGGSEKQLLLDSRPSRASSTHIPVPDM